jgi:hypothetical protein
LVSLDPWDNHPDPDPEPVPEPDAGTVEGLLALLKVQLGLLVAVSTGGPRIEDVNPEYQEMRQRLVNCGVRQLRGDWCNGAQVAAVPPWLAPVGTAAR